MLRTLLACSVVLASAAIACSHGGSNTGTDAGCPNDVPASCPTPAPTWADVEPIFDAHCTKCHGPGGVEASRPLDTYDHVYAERTTVLTKLHGCLMPPAPERPLSSDDRQLVLSWLVCRAPK